MVFEEAADRIPKAQQAFPLLDIQSDGHPLQPVHADGPFLTDLAIQRAALGASSSRSLVASSTVISPAWTFARTSSFFTGSFSFNGLSGDRPVLAPARTRCDRLNKTGRVAAAISVILKVLALAVQPAGQFRNILPIRSCVNRTSLVGPCFETPLQFRVAVALLGHVRTVAPPERPLSRGFPSDRQR